MKDKEQAKNEIEFTLTTISQAASLFIEKIGDRHIFLFDGEMGSGKTTFIAEICRQLGADDDFGSPTFSLVNEYADSSGKPIYHFDLYRIESPQEAFNMGVEDYFSSGKLCLVEWPDRLGPLVPDEACEVSITINPDNSRKITF